MSQRELLDLLRSPFVDDYLADGLDAVVVPVSAGERDQPDARAEVDALRDIRTGVSAGAGVPVGPGSLPLVVIGVFAHPDEIADLTALSAFDVLINADDPALESILRSIEHHPIAATSLAVLLRNGGALSVEQGLAAESSVYSTLQGGAEFAAWQAANRRAHPEPDAEPAVLSDRIDDELHIELNRPRRHNAFSRSMRDGLAAALALAVVDDSIERILISGRGPSFCSGGDLGEFGSFPDPATAHRTRLTRSPARLMQRLASRTTVQLHGACMGAGIELPAFAGHITAAPDTSIALPEVSLGLIPGAGGTVSLPGRIGRQRTAYLGLSGEPISAAVALEWGLVDDVR